MTMESHPSERFMPRSVSDPRPSPISIITIQHINAPVFTVKLDDDEIVLGWWDGSCVLRQAAGGGQAWIVFLRRHQ